MVENTPAEQPRPVRREVKADEGRVDLGALAPEGLPKDVTPEEIAALAAAWRPRLRARSRKSRRPSACGASAGTGAACEPESFVRKSRNAPTAAGGDVRGAEIRGKTDKIEAPQESASVSPEARPRRCDGGDRRDGSRRRYFDRRNDLRNRIRQRDRGCTAKPTRLRMSRSRWRSRREHGIPAGQHRAGRRFRLRWLRKKVRFRSNRKCRRRMQRSPRLRRVIRQWSWHRSQPRRYPAEPALAAAESLVAVPRLPRLKRAQALSAMANAATDAITAAVKELEAVAASYLEHKSTAPAQAEPASAERLRSGAGSWS